MKKLLIILILVLSGCQSTGYDRSTAFFAPCVWWGPYECHCKESRKIIFVTSDTDYSKLYEYCRNGR